jgi:glycosyltransferase involved in cell wall biosynthesis
MKHSIVIPLHNKASYVADTLLSLARQTRPPHELIIVDDVSTDGSLAIARRVLAEHPDAFARTRIEIVQLPRNGGPGHARNRGFEHTTGDIVSFLDADDTYVPDFLDTVQRHMTEHAVDFLVLGIRYVPSGLTDPDLAALRDGLTQLDGDLFLMKEPLEVATRPAFVMGVGSNVVARRDWLAAERYDERVRMNEGNDFWYRVLKAVAGPGGGRAALLMGERLHVREVPGSLSRKRFAHWHEIGYPPVLRRYWHSRDRYDRRMMRVIGGRWLRYSWLSLTSMPQRLMFLLRHRGAVLRYGLAALRQW